MSHAAHASSDHTRARGSSRPIDDAFDASTASTPVTRHATHDPGGANATASRYVRASCAASHAILGATCPGSTLQPVSSRSRSGSTRSDTASHSAPARRSHQMTAGRSGSPSASAATIPSSCEPNDSAAISRPFVAARTSDSVATSAFVHSPGSCSAQPPCGYDSACAA